jgi:hypothetical protein
VFYAEDALDWWKVAFDLEEFEMDVHMGPPVDDDRFVHSDDIDFI